MDGRTDRQTFCLPENILPPLPVVGGDIILLLLLLACYYYYQKLLHDSVAVYCTVIKSETVTMTVN